MKTSDIQIGKKYMLSLGRKGAVAVNILERRSAFDNGIYWVGVDSSGTLRVATSRRLSPCKVTDRDGNLLGYAHELNFG